MLITTYLDTDSVNHRNFTLWRYRAKGDWTDSIVGEWSTMSGSFGYRRYFYKVSDCRKYWALKINGFPTRIAAAAATGRNVPKEEVIGRMVKRVEGAGGEWIDGVYEATDGFDIGIFWEAYSRD